MKTSIYRMVIGDEEYIGTAEELAEISGYCPRTIGNIARSEVRVRKGITVECLGREKSVRSWRDDPKVHRDWEEAVAVYKNVIWVKKGSGVGRKLKL